MTQALAKFNHVFDFNGHDIRITDKDGDPWLVAKDVCKILGLKNTSQALELLDDDEKGIISMDTNKGPRQFLIISIDAAYGLALQSRKKEAKAFTKWLRKEVLPSIRKKGYYAPGKTRLQVLAEITAEMVRVEEEQVRQGVAIEAMDRSLEDHDTRLDSLEEYRDQRQLERKQAQRNLFDLSKDMPDDGVPVQAKPLRNLLNEVVRQFAFTHDLDIRHTWIKVYTEFKHRYHIDIMTRTHNENRRRLEKNPKAKKVNYLDIAEKEDVLHELLKVARIICTPEEQSLASIF